MVRGETGGQGWTAYADESFLEAERDGFYVLAAATFTPSTLDDLREVLVGTRGRRKIDELHWSQMDHRDRVEAAERLADVGGAQLVAVATPVPLRRQERARVRCLTELVSALHARGVTSMVAEAREQVLDRRGVATLSAATAVDTRKARLPVCPRSPGLAARRAPTERDYEPVLPKHWHGSPRLATVEHGGGLARR